MSDSPQRIPFVTPIVGNFYRPMYCRELLYSTKDEAILKLVPEPTNKFDHSALAVYLGDSHVGYVGKTVNKPLLAYMQAKELHTLQGSLLWQGSNPAVKLDLSEPILP